MEEAVRGLVGKGVRPQRIRISQGVPIRAGERRVRKAPELGGLLLFGLALGGAVGAAMALAWVHVLSTSADIVVPLALVVVRMLGEAASGALLGGLIAVLLFAAHRSVREEFAASADDFVVTVVKPPDESAANEVSAFLARRGGRLVLTSP